MKLPCKCLTMLEFASKRVKEKARWVEADYDSRLNSFREGIIEGANEITARHLYRAGIMLSSLNNNLNRRPSSEMILSSLQMQLYGELREFYLKYKPIVQQQSMSVENNEVLRRLLRKPAKAPGLLKLSADRELELANDSLARLRKITDYLTSWRENIRLQSRVAIIEVADMHVSP
jgi:hypothetical protein